MGLMFLGCATTDPEQPPDNAKQVGFRAPEVGTRAEWKTVANGEETSSVVLFAKEEIDGVMAYCWKNMEKEVASVFDLATMSFKGRWSLKNGEWLASARPNDGSMRFPLWAGKKYPANYLWSEKGGWNGRISTWVNIEAWEQVTVPAGTFEALRIIQQDEHFSYTHWYVPELGMGVKYIFSSSNAKRSGELVSIVKP